jgi:hypothetical protein
MITITPTGYDPENRLVSLEGGSCREGYFIRQAGINFRQYGKPDLLLWAIENELPGLIEDEYVRDVFALLVRGKLRKRGDKPSTRLKSDKLKEKVIQRIWFHIGRGLPVYVNSQSLAYVDETACVCVALEGLCSADYAHKIWLEYGGHSPQGGTKMASKFYIGKGKASLQEDR